jgi:hypothetical protein
VWVFERGERFERGEGWACGHCFRHFSFAHSSSFYVVLELGVFGRGEGWACGPFPLLTLLTGATSGAFLGSVFDTMADTLLTGATSVAFSGSVFDTMADSQRDSFFEW